MAIANMVPLYPLLSMFMFSYAYENIALHKPAWQSSQYPSNDDKLDASNAVDGLKSNLIWNGGQCAISGKYQQSATWRVDLEDILSVNHILIFYRTDNETWGPTNSLTTRFLGFSLYVSNTTDRTQGKLCFHDTRYTRATIPAILDINCPFHGRYIIYYNERLQGRSYPDDYSPIAFNDLCEVEVYGCPSPGFYGVNCSLSCPNVNCKYCHIKTGACQGCKPGYKGHQCQIECDRGKYGEGCLGDCGNCADPLQCHHTNGTCLDGCKEGFKPGTCKDRCDKGKYGQDCGQSCGVCLKSEQCHHIHGTCLKGCDPGFKGGKCKEKCDNRTYGQDCSEKCGFCLNLEKCNYVSGSCSNGCILGYKGDTCNGKCDGRRYGMECKQRCGYCMDLEQCHYINGTCLQGCNPGYQGLKCNDKCGDHFYGPGCNQTCGKCREGKLCQHINGFCNDGCEPGYQGDKCDEVCEFGHFGASCREACSVFCLKSRDCHHMTGNCRFGCKNGWRGNDCLEVANQEAGNEWEARFYGVLGAFSITLVVVVVVLFVLYKLRNRQEVNRNINKKYQMRDPPSSRRSTLTQGESDENVNSDYLEVVHINPSSTYYCIH